MHKDFIDEDDMEQCFGHTIEEMSEALVACGKIVRFGYDSYNPLLPDKEIEYNCFWLERELVDVQGAIERYLPHLRKHMRENYEDSFDECEETLDG